MNQTIQDILKRRSTRAFQKKLVPEDDLSAILEAGLYAPSAVNEQPWHFTVIQNKDMLAELNVKTKELLKKHPNPLFRNSGNDQEYNIFYHAPTVIIVSSQDDALVPQIDCAVATENMLIAAQSLGIASCWIGNVKWLFETAGDEYKTRFKLPQGYTPSHGISLGYSAIPAVEAPPRKGNAINYIK